MDQEGGKALDKKGWRTEGQAPTSLTLPHRREEALGSKPGSCIGSGYHGGEPHSRVNEKLWGLGQALVDPPQRHGHAEGVQEDEGKAKHLEGKQK